MMRLAIGSLFLFVAGCGFSGAVAGEGAASISKDNCEPCDPDAGDGAGTNKPSKPGAPGDGGGGNDDGDDDTTAGSGDDTPTCENGCVVRPGSSTPPNGTNPTTPNTPPQIVPGNPANPPGTPAVPFTPLPPPPSSPGCGLVPPTCPASKTLPDGSACDPMGSDWWPRKEEDQAGTHHTPAGSGITDLHAEHITPYGGWFTFTSLQTSEYDDDILLCWSTEEAGLDTEDLVRQAQAEERCISGRTFARTGVELFPLIIYSLEPDTTYYVRAAYEVFEGVDNPSNVVSFKTLPSPLVALNDVHPRLFATQDQLDKLKTRYDANDERTRFWVELSENRAKRAYDPNDDISGAGSFATIAGMLATITGKSEYIEGGKYLIENILLPQYETVLDGNNYRWASVHLSAATDMLWNYLDAPMRQRILDATLMQDEAPDHINPRFTDTDEHVATVQNQIAHGLTFLGATDLDAGSLQRMQVVFERAMRQWYGAVLVKARRGDKVWGMSGGAMDEGIGYSRGTQEYWLQTLWMLENSGHSQADYAQWVWNHARAQTIYGVLPDMAGYVTYGDIEEVMANGALHLEPGTWSYDALNICLLEKYCWADEAGYVQDALRKQRTPEEYLGPHHWGLLCDNSELKQDISALPTAFRSNGVGLVFDRTGWGKDDSFFFFEAGWRAVDHVHDDAGHFALWSQNKFVTTEIASYDTSNAEKHNVLILSGSNKQDHTESPGLSQIMETDTNSERLYILADLTTAYNQDFDDLKVRVIHDQVTRSVIWNKQSNAVLVYDRVVGGPSDETGEQLFQGSPVVTPLYNAREGNRLEILSIVNGVGELSSSDTEIGVAGLGSFDRSTGKLIQ